MELNFTVMGEPVAQGRPRFSSKARFTRPYDPAKSRKYKDYVRRVAQEYAPQEPLTGQLQVEIYVYKPSLKSFSKKKAEQAEQKILRPITKPDVDNYAKGIKDALNKIIWKDDSQVVDLRVQKFYSKNPRVEIRVKEIEI